MVTDPRKQPPPEPSQIRILPGAIDALALDISGVPRSKSHAQRALCLDALLPGQRTLQELPAGRDVQGLIRALAGRTGVVDLVDNGTGLRLLSVFLPLVGETARLDAGPRLRERPLQASIEFLARYGGRVEGAWPRCFTPPGSWPKELGVDAVGTTQVASGVLLGAGIRLARDGAQHLVHVRQPQAREYLLVTLEVLRAFGIETQHWWDEGDLLVEFERFDPGAAGTAYEVPLDASSFVFVRALAALHGLQLREPPSDAHPDWRFAEDLQQLLAAEPGARLWFRKLARRPDTFPALTALAALRMGETRFVGIPSLRHKECDRIRAMAEGLGRLGARCEELPDGLVVRGPLPEQAGMVQLDCPDDHRIVMALSLLGTRLPAGIQIAPSEAVRKSWPGFFAWLSAVAEVQAPEPEA